MITEQAETWDRDLDDLFTTRRRDQNRQQQSDGVGDDAPLSTHDLLAGIDALAAGVDAGGGLDALRVDQAGRRLSVPPFLPPQQLSEQAVELGEHAFLLVK